MTMPPPVPIAGMLVPASTAVKIIAAVRRRYPDVTAGLDDDAAIRAWLKHIVAVTLAEDAAQQATAPLPEAIEQTRAQYAAAADAARAQALAEAATITDQAPPAP